MELSDAFGFSYPAIKKNSLAKQYEVFLAI